MRVSYFFDDMPSNVLAGRPVSLPRRKASLGDADAPFDRDKDPLKKPETQALLRAYSKIQRKDIRKGIYQLIRRIGAAGPADGPARRRKR